MLFRSLHDRDCFGCDGEEPEMRTLGLDVIEEALLWASGASAINCSRKGCSPPTKEEVRALLASL